MTTWLAVEFRHKSAQLTIILKPRHDTLNKAPLILKVPSRTWRSRNVTEQKLSTFWKLSTLISCSTREQKGMQLSRDRLALKCGDTPLETKAVSRMPRRVKKPSNYQLKLVRMMSERQTTRRNRNSCIQWSAYFAISVVHQQIWRICPWITLKRHLRDCNRLLLIAVETIKTWVLKELIHNRLRSSSNSATSALTIPSTLSAQE